MGLLVAANFFDQNFSSILNGVALGMLIFVLAIGLSLIFGMLDVINLAHGSLYLLGTYLGYQLVEHQGLPFILAAIIALVFGIGLGIILAAALHPIRDRGHLDQVLLTSAYSSSRAISSRSSGGASSTRSRRPVS